MCFMDALAKAESGADVFITDEETSYQLIILDCQDGELFTNSVPMLKKARNSNSDSFLFFSISLEAIKSDKWFEE